MKSEDGEAESSKFCKLVQQVANKSDKIIEMLNLNNTLLGRERERDRKRDLYAGVSKVKNKNVKLNRRLWKTVLDGYDFIEKINLFKPSLLKSILLQVTVTILSRSTDYYLRASEELTCCQEISRLVLVVEVIPYDMKTKVVSYEKKPDLKS